MSIEDYMSPGIYDVMKVLEARKRIPILLLLKEKGRMKISDFYVLVPEKTGSGSQTTIREALSDLVKVGLVKTIVRDEAREWVDYELTDLGRKVADKISEIIAAIKRSQAK